MRDREFTLPTFRKGQLNPGKAGWYFGLSHRLTRRLMLQADRIGGDPDPGFLVQRAEIPAKGEPDGQCIKAKKADDGKSAHAQKGHACEEAHRANNPHHDKECARTK